MLSKDGITARFIFSFCFFFLSGTTMITGNIATISGVIGTILLTSALLHYSPLVELLTFIKTKKENS
ncbi:MAG: YgaP-like transmembrane domain [Syntrophomonadaceae bacterium]